MDKEMETIARMAFWGARGVLNGVNAACEAVLAEQKRREAHEATSEVAQKIGNQMLQNLRRNVSEERKQEQRMDATMADEVRQQLATMYSLDAVEKAIRDELEKNHKWLDMHKPAFIDAVRARLTAKQQPAATMYSLEQVEKAVLHIADNRTGCPDWPQFVAAVRARLTAKQPPTEQEIVTAFLEKWADGDDADKTNELSASEVAAKILAALGKGGH